MVHKEYKSNKLQEHTKYTIFQRAPRPYGLYTMDIIVRNNLSA